MAEDICGSEKCRDKHKNEKESWKKWLKNCWRDSMYTERDAAVVWNLGKHGAGILEVLGIGLVVGKVFDKVTQ